MRGIITILDFSSTPTASVFIQRYFLCFFKTQKITHTPKSQKGRKMKKILCALLGMMFAIPGWAENESYTNLLDNNTFLYGYHYGPSTGNLEKYSGRTATQPISVKDIDSISIRFSTNKNQVQTAFIAYDENGAMQQRNTTSLGMGITEGTYDVSQYDKVAFFWWNTDASVGQPGAITNVMVVKGSTPQDYTPYLYPIKIATTAYNSARFSPVVTELNDTIATIRSVVTNTINQTKAIADLQATKQTRPDENCPAGKKCLLVEDNDGTPHWYEIIENAYGLPSGYTALEYIQSRGAQYINTGIYATQNTAIETRFINLNNTSNTSILIGNGWSGGNYQLSIVAQTGAPNKIGGLTNTLRDFWTTNTDFVVSMNKNGLYVNNSLKAWSGTLTEFNSNNANPLYLLGDPTASNRYTYAKLFYMKIYDDNVLWRNFVPAKRDSDGVIGLYDTVTYTFFTNAGSGTFVAGPEI